jgi:hypothetical protein
MTRKFAVLAAALAAFAFTAQPADARHRKPIDPTINATSFWVGAASGAAGLAWHGNAGAAYGVTSFGCAVVSPMVATVALKRQLKYREAHILIASCFIPFVGGWLVNEAYNNGTLWAPDEKPVRKVHHRKKKKM